jgi:L-fuconolactonase
MPIDTHMHLASGDLTRYPFAASKPLETDVYENTAEQFIALMDEAGVDGAMAVQAFGLYGFDNDYHADASAAHSERLAGVCGMSADLPDAPAVLRFWIKDRGMAGVRLAYYGPGNVLAETDANLLAMLEEAAALQIPVCFLTTKKNLPTIGKLAQKFPKLQVALDHLGVVLGKPDQVADVLFALAPIGNIHLKFSTPILTAGPEYLAFMHKVVDRFGVHRLMWSSDFPHTNVGGYRNMVEIALKAFAHLPESERYALFDGTALGLWPQLKGAKAAGH